MRIVADLHIHSPYSRAVSREMTLGNLDEWARMKGITVMGTGDFTHPRWIKEIETNLEPAEKGLFRLKTYKGSANKATRFLLTVELSSIYSKGGKTRRVHTLIFAPSLDTAKKINLALGARGNIASDGRPILGLDVKEIARIVLDIDEQCMVIPAHAWTPWFSVFGSMSGFDSLEECFEEYTRYIYAIETGLSSDPEMNWRVSALDTVALISNSDSHSLRRIGREANVFDCPLSYGGIRQAIISRDPARFLFTVEFYPEEGKYHYDGHRACKFSCTPEETKRLAGRCPQCGKGLTVGVMNRVGGLADRPLGYRPPGAIPFRRLVMLDQIVAESMGKGLASKKVKEEYQSLIRKFGNEFVILCDTSVSDLTAATLPIIAEGIRRARVGELKITPGYDGEYGRVSIFTGAEDMVQGGQVKLFA